MGLGVDFFSFAFWIYPLCSFFNLTIAITDPTPTSANSILDLLQSITLYQLHICAPQVVSGPLDRDYQSTSSIEVSFGS